MSIEFSEVPASDQQAAPMSSVELDALMADGRVESRIRACTNMLKVAQSLPAGMGTEQAATLQDEIETLAPLLALPDEELLEATADMWQSAPEPESSDTDSTPTVVTLYAVLPFAEPEESPKKEYSLADALALLEATTDTKKLAALGEAALYELSDTIGPRLEDIQGRLLAVIDAKEQQALAEQVLEEELVEDTEVPMVDDTIVSAELALAEEDFIAPETQSQTTEQMPEPEVSLLPADFEARVLALARETPAFYSGDVVTTAFETTNPGMPALGAMYAALADMVQAGRLQKQGSRGFALPAGERAQIVPQRSPKQIPDTSRSGNPNKTGNLAQKIHVAGIVEPTSPFRRRRRQK